MKKTPPLQAGIVPLPTLVFTLLLGGALFISLFFSLSQFFQSQQDKWHSTLEEREKTSLHENLRDQIVNRIDSLKRMAFRWSLGLHPKKFVGREDCKNYLLHFTHLKRIYWLNQRGHPLMAIPTTQGEDKTSFTLPPASGPLVYQKEKSLIIILKIPTRSKDEKSPRGYLAALYDMESLIQEIEASGNTNFFRLTSRKKKESSSSLSPGHQILKMSPDFAHFDVEWRLVRAPRPQIANFMERKLPPLLLMGSLSISLLMTTVLLLYFQSHQRSARLVELNDQLATEMKEREKSQNLFQTTFDQSPLGIVLVSPERKFLKVNPAFSDFLGYDKDEILASTVQDVTWEGDRESTKIHLRSLASDEISSFQVNKRYCHKEGYPLWGRLTATKINIPDHEEVCFLALLEDITEITQVQKKLNKFFHLSIDLLCLVDQKGYFKEVNPAFIKTLGYSKEELLSRPFIEFVHANDRQETLEVFQNALEDGKSVLKFKNRYRAKDGSYRWLSWHSITPEEEEIIYAAARDVTEEKKQEAQLQRYAQKLKASNRELKEFAYVASHDLKEPLRMVRSFLNLLERRCGESLGEEAQEYIDFALGGAERMGQLIDDLLTLSQIQTKEIEFAPTSLKIVLDQALKNLTPLIEEKGAKITAEALPEIEADQSQMIQLFQNIISNSLKFQPSGQEPRIHLRGREVEGGWEISIKDNGIGMEANQLERIFSIFQRLHTSKEYPGTGIGLAICKKIIDRHQGDIWVESEPGKGTVFTFILPEKEGKRPEEDSGKVRGSLENIS